MDIFAPQSATDQMSASGAVPRLSMVLMPSLFFSGRKYDWICIAHTGVFCAHVVGSVTVVELNFVTLTRPESEPLEGVLETEDAFPAASLTDDFVETVEFALGVRDGFLVVVVAVDAFNGLDAGFLPDECSAKEWCIVKNVVYVYHGRRLVD